MSDSLCQAFSAAYGDDTVAALRIEQFLKQLTNSGTWNDVVLEDFSMLNEWGTKFDWAYLVFCESTKRVACICVDLL